MLSVCKRKARKYFGQLGKRVENYPERVNCLEALRSNKNLSDVVIYSGRSHYFKMSTCSNFAASWCENFILVWKEKNSKCMDR